jgi:hypothetical protein
MKLSSRLSARLFFTFATLFAFAAFQPVASASVITTDQYATADAHAASQARVNDFLRRDDVRAELEKYGVNPADAQERVASLTPEELAALDRRIGELPAGGDVIAVIGIVFIVLLVLELVGVTNVFSKF